MDFSKIGGGHSVFVNPPYGRELHKWVEKSYFESMKPNTVVVMLIPSRTDTKYWHDFILNNHAFEVRFIKGRVHFTNEDGLSGDCAPFPSAIIIFKDTPDILTGETKTTVFTTM